MNVKEAIEIRRAYRALAPVKITSELIRELANAAQLAPSCFNMQPWNYVFVHEPEMLDKMYSALSQGNEWAENASLIIAVFSDKEADCIIREREYFLFDTGLATGQMLLRATEMNLIAHPIAGFSPRKVKKILAIPENKLVIALIVVGKRSNDTTGLAEHQIESESQRPERRPLDEWTHINRYNSQD